MCLFDNARSGSVFFSISSCAHCQKDAIHSIAEYEKTSVGWFFDLKLHIVTNDLGEFLAFKITRGSRSDSQEAVPLLKEFKGLAFGDKGYLGKKIVSVSKFL